mgnify:FL=1
MINTNKSLENVLRKVVVAAYEAAMDLDEEHEVRVYISKTTVSYHTAKINEPIAKMHENVPVKLVYSFSFPTDEELLTWIEIHKFKNDPDKSEEENEERLRNSIIDEFKEKFADSIVYDIVHGIRRV